MASLSDEELLGRHSKGKARSVGGPNSLRGGKRHYNPSVKLGNWTEDVLDPEIKVEACFSSPLYATMQHLAMMEGRLLRPKIYGQALPPEEDSRIDYSKVFNPDKEATPVQWKPVTASFHKGSSSVKAQEFSNDPLHKLNNAPSGLSSYLERWTTERPGMREERFSTTNNTMLNSAVMPKWRIREVRLLPGLPAPVENVLRKIHERDPGRGVQVFSKHLQDVTGENRLCSVTTLITVLKALGLSFPRQDLDRAVAYFDPISQGTIEVDKLLQTLRGTMSEARVGLVKSVFSQLIRKAHSDAGALTLANIAQLYNPYAEQAVVDGKVPPADSLRHFVESWTPYCSTKGDTVYLEDFLRYYGDVQLAFASDDFFRQTLAGIWNVDPTH